jgi:hypothetical protein
MLTSARSVLGMARTRERLAILGFITVLMFSAHTFAQPPAAPKRSLQVPPHGPSLEGKRARDFSAL